MNIIIINIIIILDNIMPGLPIFKLIYISKQILSTFLFNFCLHFI